MAPLADVETWALGERGSDLAGAPVREKQLSSLVRSSGASLCHFYTNNLPSGSILRNLPVPWIAASSGVRWRLFRRERVVSLHDDLHPPRARRSRRSPRPSRPAFSNRRNPSNQRPPSARSFPMQRITSSSRFARGSPGCGTTLRGTDTPPFLRPMNFLASPPG